MKRQQALQFCVFGLEQWGWSGSCSWCGERLLDVEPCFSLPVHPRGSAAARWLCELEVTFSPSFGSVSP